MNPVSNPGIQKIPANAVVHPDPIRNFLHIGAARFANRRDPVDV
jgi:hypothetical protein